MSKRRPVSLKRALKAFARRHLNYSEITQDDYRWLFAGYVKGVFSDISIPKDLEPAEFLDFFEPLSKEYGLVVYRDEHNKPLCLAVFTSISAHVKETKLFFMPWTSLTDKVLTMGHFYGSAAQELNVTVMARERDLDLFKHVANYGVFKKAGVILDAYPDTNENGWYFQGRNIPTPWLNSLEL